MQEKTYKVACGENQAIEVTRACSVRLLHIVRDTPVFEVVTAGKVSLALVLPCEEVVVEPKAA